MPCRICRRIPGFCPLDVSSSSPSCQDQKCLQILSNIPWGAKLSLAENVLLIVNHKPYIFLRIILKNHWVELEFKSTHGSNGENLRWSQLQSRTSFFFFTKLRNTEIKMWIISPERSVNRNCFHAVSYKLRSSKIREKFEVPFCMEYLGGLLLWEPWVVTSHSAWSPHMPLLCFS